MQHVSSSRDTSTDTSCNSCLKHQVCQHGYCKTKDEQLDDLLSSPVVFYGWILDQIKCKFRPPYIHMSRFLRFLRWLQMTIAQPSAYAQPSMIPFLKPHDMYCHLVLLTFQKVFGKGSKKRFQKNFFLTFFGRRKSAKSHLRIDPMKKCRKQKVCPIGLSKRLILCIFDLAPLLLGENCEKPSVGA